MRVLLDECLPRRLGKLLTDHQVKTVPEAGWAGVKNGDLLGRAELEFDVFITIDRSMTFQQNISRFKLALIVLHAKTNRLEDLKPLVSEVSAEIGKCVGGKTIHVSSTPGT